MPQRPASGVPTNGGLRAIPGEIPHFYTPSEPVEAKRTSVVGPGTLYRYFTPNLDGLRHNPLHIVEADVHVFPDFEFIHCSNDTGPATLIVVADHDAAFADYRPPGGQVGRHVLVFM